MERGKTIKALASGLLAGVIVSVVLILLFAFVTLKLQPDAGKMELMIMVIYVLANLAGGWCCGHRQERRKFVWGLLTGAVYFLLVFLVSGMSEQQVQPEISGSLLALVLCAAGGMVGGMLS